MTMLTETAQKRLETVHRRPVLAPLVEAAGIAVWAVLWVAFARRALSGPFPGVVVVLLVAFLGIAFADFMSGVMHWFFDTFLEESTPILGRQFVAPFREHHRDPLAMTRHGFLELNGNNCLGSLPINLSVWWFAPVEPESVVGVAGYLFLVTFSFALTATNQLHSWAHEPARPALARWLQRLGLAISPARHARHHAPPHDVSYCVTNGWVNSLTDRIQFFVYAERLLIRLGVPRRPVDSAD
jgi:ubiquitin-conjugating enzyme E2 variant